jgi:PAS domain S-box-containing protein
MPARKKKFSRVNKSGKVGRRLTTKPIKSARKKKSERSDSQSRSAEPHASESLCIWEWDIKANRVWLSENVHKIFRTSKKNLTGTYDSVMKLLQAADKKMIAEEIKKCLDSKKEYFVHYRISDTDQKPRWIEAIAKVFRDAKGEPVKMMGSFKDVTEMKLAEVALKEWEARYKFISTASNLVIYDFDLKTGDIEWSGTTQEVLGYKPNEMGDINEWEKRIHRSDRKKILTQLEIAKQGLKTFDVQYRFKSESKKYIDIHDRGMFLVDETGQPYRMLGTMLDISEKIRIEKDLIETNRFKESMENAMPGILYVYDLKKQVNIYVNHNITRMLGYTWEEMEQMGNNIIQTLVHEEDIANLTKWSNEASRTVKDAEYRLRARNGEWRWFHSRDTVFQRAPNGKVTQVIGIAQDITARKKMEEELRESEERFRTLQEASFGGIGLHDKGAIIDCNNGLCLITGYSREELIGRDGLTLIVPEYRDLVMQNILTGYEKAYDVEGIHKDGTRYSLEICGKSVPYKGREIRVTEFRDITARKLIEQKILEQNAKLHSITADLKRKNEQLEEFTQIVSHNLRSPMGNIATLLTFMETSTSDTDRAQFMKFLKESSSNALTTLDELNEVLKLKQNSNIEKQHLEFEKVFNHVKAMISAKIAESSAEIHYDFSRAPSIHYPQIYLESIFLNLLTNALKYSKPDQKPVIKVKTHYQDNKVILEVKDNGLGINLQRYGHQIFKLQKTFHKHPESRGIGLFMIKNQIEAMGGEIAVESQEGTGTTFIVNFNKHHNNEDEVAHHRPRG